MTAIFKASSVPVPMPVPPVRQYSFTDWQVNNPTAPPPGDRMDAECDRANAAITRIIDWIDAGVSAPLPSPTDDNADNDAAYSAALAKDYADVTQAWAEHMPDTIPPNILAVMGVTGDHWSSRWWAHQAAITFGARQRLQSLLYRATANQTVFPLTTPDLAGHTYAIVSIEPLDVFVNGVRLPPDDPNPGNGDWTLDPGASTVTFLTPLLADSMVQIDVLSPDLGSLDGLLGNYLPLTGGTIAGGGIFIDCRAYQPMLDTTANSALLVRWTNTSTPGAMPPNNGVSAPINVVASDYAGAVQSIWGVAVSMSVYSTMFGTAGVGPWPQHVGGSFTVFKYGNCYVAGAHLTSVEAKNNPSSLTGPLHGIEIAHQANADDDGGLASAPGLRFGFHMSQAQRIPATGTGDPLTDGKPCVFGVGYGQSNSGGSTTKSAFAAVDSVTYQVFDARRATAPSGYTDPVAALRMAQGQIIDFNGAATTTKAGWIGPAGSYLQYYANSRLRWVTDGTEVFSIRDDGLVQLEGTLLITATPVGQPSITILQEEFISFNNAGNRTLKFTAVGGPQRLSYAVAGTDMFSIADTGLVTTKALAVGGSVGFNGTAPIVKPTVSGAKGGNVALANLLTVLAAYGLITDGTAA